MSSEALFARGLEPGAYTSRDFFDAEQRLWESCWVVLGYAADVRETDSFLTGKLGQLEVVVQRFSAGLSAFVNRCAHRHMCLQQARTGRRSLSCPYHGWRYGADGRPTSMPMLPKALLEHAQTDAEFHLKKLHVEERYGLIWVNASASPESLDAYLGPETRALLQATSELMEDRFHHQTDTWAANWKLAVESGVEGFHVATVHTQSLLPAMDARSLEVTTFGRHSIQTQKLTPALRASLQRFRERVGVTVPQGLDDGVYVQFLVFPFFAVGVLAGTMLSTEFSYPRAPESTEFEATLWMKSLPNASAGIQAVKQGIQANFIADTKLVIDEDRRVTEAVQRNLHFNQHRAVFSLPWEARLSHFHQTLQEAMK